MVICPIAKAVHCTGCPFVKFCPAKTTLGDYGKIDDTTVSEKTGKKEVHGHEQKPRKSNPNT